jgi:predicted ATPase
VAAREGQLPPALAAALSAALRDDRLTRVAPAPLSQEEAAELVGEAAATIYPQTGGNPFYLEQLARAGDGPRAETAAAADRSVSPPVAAALTGELTALTPEARRLLDAAAVTGDPFEPALAAEVAELSEAAMP